MEVTPRGIAGVRVGEDGWISIEICSFSDGEPVLYDHRYEYCYYIDESANTLLYAADDLKSGVGGGTLVQGLSSLLAFLLDDVERFRYCEDLCKPTSDEKLLFPRLVVEWAARHEDELSMIKCELEEYDAKK